MMTAVIHQAHFLPWLGFFNKIAHADRFIVLDNVQFNVRDYHNRAKIKNMHGREQWLTLPVNKGSSRALAQDVTVVNEHKMLDIFQTIHHSYAQAPYYHEYWPAIRSAIESGFPHLLSINVRAIQAVLQILGLDHVQILFSSAYYSGDDATERLVQLCQATGSDQLIMGEMSWLCHDLDYLRQEEITITKQVFLQNHPVYPQIRGDFIVGLSIIDVLFNIGPKETLQLALEVWRPESDR